MGAPRVIARSNDDLHARILALVGAELVVNPEREFGERFANRVLHDDIRGEMSLGEGILISELEVPDSFVGVSLADLGLPTRFGVTVVAVRRGASGEIVMPSADFQFLMGDVMVVVAKEDAVTQMTEAQNQGEG
jgi:trk system potassium uptake protein TrkA